MPFASTTVGYILGVGTPVIAGMVGYGWRSLTGRLRTLERLLRRKANRNAKDIRKTQRAVSELAMASKNTIQQVGKHVDDMEELQDAVGEVKRAVAVLNERVESYRAGRETLRNERRD